MADLQRISRLAQPLAPHHFGQQSDAAKNRRSKKDEASSSNWIVIGVLAGFHQDRLSGPMAKGKGIDRQTKIPYLPIYDQSEPDN